MARFKIRNETGFKVDLSDAVKLLRPYFHFVSEDKYPLLIVIQEKENDMDRSFFDPKQNEGKGTMTLRYAKDQPKDDRDWVFIHEFGHFLENNNDELKKATEVYENIAIQELFKKLFRLRDTEVTEIFHDFFPAEVFSNSFATILTGKYFKRHPFSEPAKLLKKLGIDVKKVKDDSAKELLLKMQGIEEKEKSDKANPMKTNEYWGFGYDKNGKLWETDKTRWRGPGKGVIPIEYAEKYFKAPRSEITQFANRDGSSWYLHKNTRRVLPTDLRDERSIKLWKSGVRTIDDMNNPKHSLKELNDPSILKKLHARLYDMIVTNGRSYPKKHGNWVKLGLGVGYGAKFFQVDTWSKAITLKDGEGTYNEHIGFAGQPVKYYGLDFGGFETKATAKDFAEAIKMAGSK